MRKWACLIGLSVLAACGADGAPERPERDKPIEPGVRISGTASIGVVGGSSELDFK